MQTSPESDRISKSLSFFMPSPRVYDTIAFKPQSGSVAETYKDRKMEKK